jgi:hypothetical protein
MPDQRSLPMIIGPTENALRALLHRLLATTPIRSYERWVALNVIARSAGSRDDAGRVLADGLKADAASVDSILAGLRADELINDTDDDLRLSAAGAATFDRARSRIGDVTARLVHTVPPASVEIAFEVLDEVRSNAELELADLS